MFRKAFPAVVKKLRLFGKDLKRGCFPTSSHFYFASIALILSYQISTVKTLKKRPFKNSVEKEENSISQHFLLFPQFSTLPKTEIIDLAIFSLSSASAFNLI